MFSPSSDRTIATARGLIVLRGRIAPGIAEPSSQALPWASPNWHLHAMARGPFQPFGIPPGINVGREIRTLEPDGTLLQSVCFSRLHIPTHIFLEPGADSHGILARLSTRAFRH